MSRPSVAQCCRWLAVGKRGRDVHSPRTSKPGALGEPALDSGSSRPAYVKHAARFQGEPLQVHRSRRPVYRARARSEYFHARMECRIACSRSSRFGPEALRAPIPPHRRAASAIWQWGFIERFDDGLYYIEVGPEENARVHRCRRGVGPSRDSLETRASTIKAITLSVASLPLIRRPANAQNCRVARRTLTSGRSQIRTWTSRFIRLPMFGRFHGRAASGQRALDLLGVAGQTSLAPPWSCDATA